MKACVGIDRVSGRPYVQLEGESQGEWDTLEALQAWLPIVSAPAALAAWNGYRVYGDRLPGMGVTCQYQDATAVNVDGTPMVEPGR